jgi:RimJ/RimL family protein N-acetyltransferase
MEIAYLLDSLFWGPGLATEPAQGILLYARYSLLIYLIDLEHMGSLRVAEKISIQLEKRVGGIAGDNYPTLIYSMS